MFVLILFYSKKSLRSIVPVKNNFYWQTNIVIFNLYSVFSENIHHELLFNNSIHIFGEWHYLQLLHYLQLSYNKSIHTFSASNGICFLFFPQYHVLFFFIIFVFLWTIFFWRDLTILSSRDEAKDSTNNIYMKHSSNISFFRMQHLSFL